MLVKKLLVIFLLSILPVAFSCKKENVAGKDEFVIVTSFYPIYIIAKNVAYNIDGVRLANMTSSQAGCLHDYSVTAEDMKNLKQAHVFLINGAGMETFIDKITGGYPPIKTVELSKGIKLIDHGDGKNPHVWMSVSNVIVMVRNCVEALCETDAKNSESYKENGDAYIRELNDLKAETDEALKKISGEKIITFHEAFTYFAKDYDLTISAVVEHNPGMEPSAKELADLIDSVRRLKIKYIFAEPQYSSSAAEIIAKETGATALILDPIVTGPDDRDAYIKSMKKNTSVLIGAFSGK